MTTADGTSGLYYAFAYIAYSILIEVLLNQQKKWKKRAIGYILLALSIFAVIVVTDGYQEISQFLYLPICVLLIAIRFAYLKIMCQRNWIETWYYTAWAVMLSETAAAVQWQLYYFFSDGAVKLQGIFQQIFMLVLIHGLLILPFTSCICMSTETKFYKSMTNRS